MITLAHSQIYSSNLQGDISNKSMENIPSPIDIHSHPITDDPEICVMVNIPFGELSSAISDISSSAVSRFKGLVEMYPTRPIYVLCRRGMDSQRAVLLFQRVLHQWANATARHDEMSGNSDNTSVLLNEDSGCAIDPVQHRSSVNLSSDFYTTKIHQIYNLEGGLKSWGAEIDSDFPSY
jgi:rhodanese-related sulfurtransferase